MRATVNSRPSDQTQAAAANRAAQRRRASNEAAQADLRTAGLSSTPRVIAQRKQLQAAFGNAIQRKTGPEDEELLQGKFPTAQREVAPEEEELQMKAAVPVAQRQGPEEEEPLQGKFLPTGLAAQLAAGPEREPNRTGLPDSLKSGIEALSGLDMSDVRVHRNSTKPGQLNALAYAQGSDIHLAPGQERHLPHEAWHAVQQRQGRVKATMQMAEGVPVNDDERLEREADAMGARALRHDIAPVGRQMPTAPFAPAVQRMTARIRRKENRAPTAAEIAATRDAAIANSQRLAGHGRARHGRQVEVPSARQQQQAAADQQAAVDQAIQLQAKPAPR